LVGTGWWWYFVGTGWWWDLVGTGGMKPCFNIFVCNFMYVGLSYVPSFSSVFRLTSFLSVHTTAWQPTNYHRPEHHRHSPFYSFLLLLFFPCGWRAFVRPAGPYVWCWDSESTDARTFYRQWVRKRGVLETGIVWRQCERRRCGWNKIVKCTCYVILRCVQIFAFWTLLKWSYIYPLC
jgi:hypothetical protein